MTKTCCVGRRHCASLNSKSEYIKTQNSKTVKNIMGTRSICGRTQSQHFTKLS